MLIPILLKKPDCLQCASCRELISSDSEKPQIGFLDVDLESSSFGPTKSKKFSRADRGAITNIFCEACFKELD